jgi:hypothetical protein
MATTENAASPSNVEKPSPTARGVTGSYRGEWQNEATSRRVSAAAHTSAWA